MYTSVRHRVESVRARLRSALGPLPRRWSWRERCGVAALALAAVSVMALDVWLGSCGFAGCPSTAELRAYRPPEGSAVYDRAGRLLGRLDPVRRVDVPLSRVPLRVQQAFIATEDRRFYQHAGLDWHAAARAVVRDLLSMSFREGFSTITMQVARNSFTPERARDRSLSRKLLELRCARLLEHALTKPQILSLYLNVIYLGNGVYGVEAASRDLFGKSVGDLSLAEAATLAALPKAPSSYSPRHDPERARTRRDLVLSLMEREGFISARAAHAAAKEPMRVAEAEWQPAVPRSDALDAVRAVVDSALGDDAFADGDLAIYTTLDLQAQHAAERAVSRQAAAIDRRAGRRRGREVQGAMVAADPRTGDIRAMVGGRRYAPGGMNRALLAHRQPGSAFKPFVYTAALEAGYTPASLVDDEPVAIQTGGQLWTPANYGDEYGGRMTFRTALMHSANAAAVRVSHTVGESNVVDAARRLGITSPLSPLPSIALGAMEVTPLELVTAYAPFANGGLRVHPRLVRRVEGPRGRVRWVRESTPAVRAMDPRDAFQITSMLQSVVDAGTGRTVRDLGVSGPVAGKTGTTNEGEDVWFVGYTPTIVAGFWFGYDTPSPIGPGATGGRLAAPAWADFYLRGWRGRDAGTGWRVPPGMITRVVDAETGELAGQWCPVTQREWFKPGTEPTTLCDEHHAPDPWAEIFSGRVGSAIRRIFHF